MKEAQKKYRRNTLGSLVFFWLFHVFMFAAFLHGDSPNFFGPLWMLSIVFIVYTVVRLIRLRNIKYVENLEARKEASENTSPWVKVLVVLLLIIVVTFFMFATGILQFEVFFFLK